jgi:hypothetical protein
MLDEYCTFRGRDTRETFFPGRFPNAQREMIVQTGESSDRNSLSHGFHQIRFFLPWNAYAFFSA